MVAPKRSIIIATILLLLGLAIYGAWSSIVIPSGERRSAHKVAYTGHGDSESRSEPALVGTAPKEAVEPRNSPPHSTLRNTPPQVEFPPMAVGDPAYAPESPEEVAWYVRNGYPTFAMMTAADTGIPDLTQLDASDGFSPYEVVIASNLAVADEAARDEALSFLRKAAIEGSIYALESLDAINQHPFFNNKVQAAAYHKSSIMLGNWTGAFSLARTETLSSEEDMLSTLLALQFIEHANLVRSSHGLLPLERDLRPGLDQFLKALMLDMQAKANKAKTAY